MTEPLVGIIMGSKSDWETMRHAAETLDRLGIAHETRVVSAHRTPKRLYDYAHSARERGLKVIIAGAGVQTNSQHRWGDYSSMAIDPADDCTFWYAQEYYSTTGSFNFRTRLASFKFTNCQ